jgi:hypothetical protein
MPDQPPDQPLPLSNTLIAGHEWPAVLRSLSDEALAVLAVDQPDDVAEGVLITGPYDVIGMIEDFVLARRRLRVACQRLIIEEE